MANDIPAVPLYSQPSILVYKKGITGMTNCNNPTTTRSHVEHRDVGLELVGS